MHTYVCMYASGPAKPSQGCKSPQPPTSMHYICMYVGGCMVRTTICTYLPTSLLTYIPACMCGCCTVSRTMLKHKYLYTYVNRRNVMSCHVMACRVMSCNVVVMSCHVMSRRGHVMPCCAMSCHVVALTCRAVRCCVVP